MFESNILVIQLQSNFPDDCNYFNTNFWPKAVVLRKLYAHPTNSVEKIFETSFIPTETWLDVGIIGAYRKDWSFETSKIYEEAAFL